VRAQLTDVLEIRASADAFAALRADGTVITWGDVRFGGDNKGVQEQLVGIKDVRASGGAFAAIQVDGTIVTWGDASCGGDSVAVKEQLNVAQLSSDEAV